MACPGDDALLTRKEHFKHLEQRLALRHCGTLQSPTILGAQARAKDDAKSVAAGQQGDELQPIRASMQALRTYEAKASDRLRRIETSLSRTERDLAAQRSPSDPLTRQGEEVQEKRFEYACSCDCFHSHGCGHTSSSILMKPCEDPSFKFCSNTQSVRSGDSGPKNTHESVQIGMSIERSSGATRPIKARMTIPGDEVLLAKKKIFMSRQERLAMRRFGKLQSPYLDNGLSSLARGPGIEFQPSVNERRNRFDRIPNRM